MAVALERLTPGGLTCLDAWWRAANYLTIGQIYLKDNALLRRQLTPEHIKPRLLGHWGTSPGLSFVYAHVSRLISITRQHTLYLAGLGHGGPALVAAAWLEGTYSQIYPAVSQDGEGATPLPTVLQSGRDTEPRFGNHAWLHPRRRRARIRSTASPAPCTS
jgi:xylulose-5-phosphate/fructose-6-phosphate phosphoketolase